jgi:transposase
MPNIVPTAAEMLDRIKHALRLHSDTALAKRFGVSANVVSSWRNRNAIRYETIIGKVENVSYDWLIRGDGEMFLAPPAPPPTADEKINALEQIVIEQRERLDRLTSPRLVQPPKTKAYF